MLKKIWVVFLRDLKVNSREFLTLYIIVFPILFAIGINLLTPSINDTTVNVALIKDDNTEMIAYFEDFSKVTLLEDIDSLIDRVNDRDDVLGIIPEKGSYIILAQGNETNGSVDYVKMIKTYFEAGVTPSDGTSLVHDFGRTIPPLKKMLVNSMLLMTSVLGGMLIAINIIEEKVDNTISAIHLSPISRVGFIAGKSMMGILLSVYGCVAILLITGFGHVNIGQGVLAIIACTITSILVGFIEGLKNDDVMNAAAGVKMLFLPVGAAIAAVELLSDKWQIFFYWIPFYWSYKGNAAILSLEATWPQILSYTGLVIGLSGIVFVLLAPQIRKGLE